MSDIIDDIISNITESKIFKDREKLRPDYVPEELPHREEQIRRIASILAPLLKKERPSNIFIYGLTGTGKTAVTKFVLSSLNRRTPNNFSYIYVNTRQSDTPYRVLADISESSGVKVPFTGLSTAELHRRLVKTLDRNNRILVLVLDEIDSLVKKHGDEILYRLTRINDELSLSKVSIIGITNDVKFVETLDPRVKSSLGEEELVFPPYNAEDLEDILNKRSLLSFRDGVLDPGVIKLCSALAAREHGDARRALDLLRVSGEIAEREGKERVTTNEVYKARGEIERDRLSEVIKTLPFHSKVILMAILKGGMTKPSLITGEVYEIYRQLAKRIGVESLTQRRASDIINELDMLGIINAKVINRGRYGKTKEISVSPEVKKYVEQYIREDERLSGVWD